MARYTAGGEMLCLLKEPAKAVDVVLICRIEGINSRMHSEKKRRHLKGERRRKMADAMIDGRKDAVILRCEEAGRLKKFGEKDPLILPNIAVLRKAKEQRLLTKYDLKFSNPALNLYNSSQNEQAQIYSARCRNNRNATFAFDATGGIVKREKSVSHKCKIWTMDELSYFVKSILSVALSHFIGHTPSNNILPSEERIRFLNDKIKGVPINMEEVDDDDANEFSEKRNIERGTF
ncbi:unnamed protein product [Lasius platythorax]|uniref:Uncharacterized protein n=1 Tax=Lasius platythorax TaxID=488582 RepID=A0AAV2MY76_9HYME